MEQFWQGTQEEYFLLYREAANGLKNASQRLRVRACLDTGGERHLVGVGYRREALWGSTFIARDRVS